MFQFVSDNILIVLTVFGTIISFLASFVGIISKRKPITVLAVLAVMGFTVGITYQVYDYNRKQEIKRQQEADKQIAQAAQQARDNVISEINLTVQQTKITIDSLADQLNKATITEVATELISISTSGNIDFEETMAFAKGSPGMWDTYAGWLSSTGQAKAEPCLSLTFNAHHHYDSGLLLAYLLTGSATKNNIKTVINNHSAWHNFPAQEIYLNAFTPDSAHLKWVLFYDRTTENLAGFAEAKAFSQELLVYHSLKQHSIINNLLNSRGEDTISQLQKSFPSIQKAVFKTGSPPELVKLMIDQQLAISVTTAGKKPYIVKLVRMIQLAAEKS